MMERIFLEIAVIIGFAAVLAIIFRMLRQPLVLAYILTGILLGPLGIFPIEHEDSLRTLGQLGVTLLLFMLGLEVKVKDLASIGKTALILGLLQVWFTFALGALLAISLGFSQMTAVYLGLAFAFSSTIVIVKILSDKKDINSLHGKLAIGVLLVQDFVAVLATILLSNSNSTSPFSLTQIGGLFLKLLLLLALVILLGKYIFPRVVHFISKSSESLFLFSLAWVFILAAVVSSPYIGFSIEIGGFLAGLSLANTHENFQIIARMKALRDFFITIFFVLLGIEMSFANFGVILIPALIFSAFVLVAKPFIVMAVSGVLGFRKRTSFFVAMTMGQISEFSLVLLFMGSQMQAIDSQVVTIAIFVSIVTFICSSYTMQNTNRIYAKIRHLLVHFESKKTHIESTFAGESGEEVFDDHIVLIGGDHMGQSILHAMEDEKEKILVVDFNPDTIKKLNENGISSLFGDIADPEIQERAGLNKAKTVISTAADLEDNLLLIEGLRAVNKKAIVVVIALNTDAAKTLYKTGADYVVLPHIAGGRHLAKMLIDKHHLKLIESYKERDLKFMSG